MRKKMHKIFVTAVCLLLLGVAGMPTGCTKDSNTDNAVVVTEKDVVETTQTTDVDEQNTSVSSDIKETQEVSSEATDADSTDNKETNND
jgi:hypothetical protein